MVKGVRAESGVGIGLKKASGILYFLVFCGILHKSHKEIGFGGLY